MSHSISYEQDLANCEYQYSHYETPQLMSELFKISAVIRERMLGHEIQFRKAQLNAINNVLAMREIHSRQRTNAQSVLRTLEECTQAA